MKKYFPYILIFYCSGSVSLVLFYLLKAYEKKKKKREAEKWANILVLAMIQSGKISRRELDFTRGEKNRPDSLQQSRDVSTDEISDSLLYAPVSCCFSKRANRYFPIIEPILKKTTHQ